MASDLRLHCLPMTLLQVSRKEWAKHEQAMKTLTWAGSSKCFAVCILISLFRAYLAIAI